MTLATSLRISDPGVDYRLAFLKAREFIGIPAEHPFSTKATALGWDEGVGEWVRSHPGGFRSALDVSHNHGALLPNTCDETCDQPCDYHLGLPAAYVVVRLDTTYGYRGSNGEDCDDVHREVTALLGEWLDSLGATWWCNNEYSGEWRERTPGPFARVAT